jgi:hypothetical protein
MLDKKAIYHPEFDIALSDARNRLLLARYLRDMAHQHNRSGDAALLERDWERSDRHWRLGARYMRANQAVSYACSTNPDDWPLIKAAWLKIAAGKEEQG